MKNRNWLAALFGLSAATSSAAPPPSAQKSEHAVVVHFFNYGSTDLSRLFQLEKRLESAIAEKGVGEYDGNEIATDGGDGFLYMYGPDADALFKAVKPILLETSFTRGAEAKLRYGPPKTGAKELIVIVEP